jgi:hypothetical protein
MYEFVVLDNEGRTATAKNSTDQKLQIRQRGRRKNEEGICGEESYGREEAEANETNTRRKRRIWKGINTMRTTATRNKYTQGR